MKPLLCFACAVLVLGCWTSPDTGDAGDASTTSAQLAIALVGAAPTGVVGGSALKLSIVIVAPDGTTTPLPSGTNVTWLSPTTYVAADPNDASSAALPTTSPLAFFIQNPFRPDRTDYDAVLFVVQRGTSEDPNITVTAHVDGFGEVSAYFPVRDRLVGDPNAGATAYQTFKCGGCHGDTGGGSPPESDGGATYNLLGTSYAYPAPPINASDDGTAADPAWNGAYFGLATQGNIDNAGVALRSPMPDFLGMGTAQDFANIYAFLKTQKP